MAYPQGQTFSHNQGKTPSLSLRERDLMHFVYRATEMNRSATALAGVVNTQ